MDEREPTGAAGSGDAVPEAVFIGEPVPVENPTPRELLPPEATAILDRKASPAAGAAPPATPTTPRLAAAPTPVAPAAAPRPGPAPAPTVAPKPAEVAAAFAPAPPTPLAAAPVSPAPPKPPAPVPLSLNRLRTYRDDIEVAVRAQNLSVAKVFLAEEEHRRRSQSLAEISAPDSPRNRLYTVAAGALVLAAVAVLAYFRFFHQQTPVGDLRINLPAFVRSDQTELVDATDEPVRDLAAEIGAALDAPLSERQVREVVVAVAEPDPLGGQPIFRRVPPGELLVGIGANLPESLYRSLASDYFLGTYGARTGADPIVLVTVDDHALAFAGMLAWEPTLARDLSEIFPRAWSYVSSEPKPPAEQAKFRFGAAPGVATTSTTTASAGAAESGAAASSSPAGAPATTAPAAPPGSRNRFEDIVIANKDARVLYGVSRQPLLLYAFLNPNTVLIGDDPLLVSEIFRRLSVDRQLH